MNSLNDYRHAVSVYLTNCKADNLSACTLENYRAHLEAYGNFCEQNDCNVSAPESVLDWKLLLHDAGLKNSSIATYMRDVRLFFSWACESTLCRIDANPIAGNSIPKTHRECYDKLLSEDQIMSVLAGEKKEGVRRSYLWTRNNAMCILFVESAMRVSELCAVTPADLDFENSIIYVRHGKGDKARYVSFPALAQKAVEEYLESGIRPEGLSDNEPLFGTTSKDRPEWHAFTRQQASALVNRHVKAVTGRDDVRSHALRHASASAMLMIGLPKEQIQAVLGHSCIQTTERYIGMLRPEAAAIGTADAFAKLERAACVKEVV